MNIGLLDHRGQRFLGHPSELWEAREVAPLPELRDLLRHRAGMRRPTPLAVSTEASTPLPLNACRRAACLSPKV